MIFNIDFSLAGTFFMLPFLFYLNRTYTDGSARTVAFRRLAITIFVADILSLIAVLNMDGILVVPPILNAILSVLFYEVMVLSGYIQARYTDLFLYGRSHWSLYRKLSVGFLAVCTVFIITSPFTGLLFTIDEAGIYHPGMLTILGAIMPAIFTGSAVVFVLVNRKNFENKKPVYATVAFVLIVDAFTVAQYIWVPNTILSMFACSLCILILLFSLETGDYKALVDAMELLERSEKEAKQATEAAIEARNEAIEAGKAKDTFLASMSHELRTPINGIMGMAELAYGASPNPVIQENLLDIRNAATDLLGIVSELIDYSNLEIGNLSLSEGEYLVEETFRNTVKYIRGQAARKNISFSYEMSPNFPSKLYGDVARVHQIVLHLMSNAVKYTDVGMVFLSLDWSQQAEDTGNMIITVKDTGCGISKELQKSLFGLQGVNDERRKRYARGMGIGLRIVYALVDMMKGNISVVSEEGLGSEFIVVIPQGVVDATPMGAYKEQIHAKDSMSEREEVTSPPQETRILAVDDVKMNLKVVSGLLKKIGIQVDCAESGKEALAMMEGTNYELVLMDHMMPEMDGVEVLHAMRELKGNPNAEIPVIVLTANAVAGAKEQYLEAGFDDYLAKPVNGKVLADAIYKHLPVRTPGHVAEAAKGTPDLGERKPAALYITNGFGNVVDGTGNEVTQPAKDIGSGMTRSTDDSRTGMMQSANVTENKMTQPANNIGYGAPPSLRETEMDTSIPFFEAIGKPETDSISRVTPTLFMPEVPTDILPPVEGVEWEYALMKMRDATLVQEVVHDFMDLAEGDLKELQELFSHIREVTGQQKSHAFQNYQIKVHAMKSTTAMLGAMQVSAFAKTLEFAARDERMDRLEAIMGVFIDEYELLLGRLHAAFDNKM